MEIFQSIEALWKKSGCFRFWVFEFKHVALYRFNVNYIFETTSRKPGLSKPLWSCHEHR